MSTLSLWTRRDPFAEFDALFRAVGEPRGFVPAAEIERDGDDAVVRLELPGLDAERDVTVEIEGGRLVVRGERRDERTEERGGRSLREVRYGSFHRSFGLPEHVTADDVSASYDAGVLTVRVAGAHAGSGARRIPVNTGTPAIESGEQAAA
ncbi:Hsp20/alpha crystallin family protein [Pseudonocardia zijingensis]|jgi:HSP20 family molecular chaperone IbpA|uniref:Hsp20/alpha crystallin family protein n=1 Tax=Pseudonocardia zijingensis TaxID=153376 RepID=A0ABN1PMT7_9PSEU